MNLRLKISLLKKESGLEDQGGSALSLEVKASIYFINPNFNYSIRPETESVGNSRLQKVTE